MNVDSSGRFCLFNATNNKFISTSAINPGFFRSLALFFGAIGFSVQAQTVALTTMNTFVYSNGANPYAGLVQDAKGNFYGTTAGGANTSCSLGCGTVFQVAPSGALTTLHVFSPGADGYYPHASMLLAADGNLYGTTTNGGLSNSSNCSYGCGTVFRLTPSGAFTTLYQFTGGADGGGPNAGMIQGSDGNLYGTTKIGGTIVDGSCSSGCGTVFQITPTGTLKTAYSFKFSDGAIPTGGVIQATDGNFYGTTFDGGASGDGTVFQLTAAGRLNTLHSFKGSDGADPYAGLIQASDGNFYGTTQYGGVAGYGTIFQMTPNGVLNTQYQFRGTDGANPTSPLIQGSDGNFYGTTTQGGVSTYGTLIYGSAFQLTPTGVLTTLHAFIRTDGSAPYGGLIEGADGNFYGTTEAGGFSGYGIVFKLQLPPGPPPPTGLTAKTALFGQATLAWTASPGATSYNVYQGTASMLESTTPILTGITATSAIVSDLSAKQTYCFTVVGVNADGVGLPSNESCITRLTISNKYR